MQLLKLNTSFMNWLATARHLPVGLGTAALALESLFCQIVKEETRMGIQAGTFCPQNSF